MKFNNIHDFLRCFACISASFAIECERDPRRRVYLRRRRLVYTVVLNLTDRRRRSVVMRRGKRRKNIEPIFYDAISAYFPIHRPWNFARRTRVFMIDTYFLTHDCRFVVFNVFFFYFYEFSGRMWIGLRSDSTKKTKMLLPINTPRVGFMTSLLHVRVPTNRLRRYVVGRFRSPGNDK